MTKGKKTKDAGLNGLIRLFDKFINGLSQSNESTREYYYSRLHSPLKDCFFILNNFVNYTGGKNMGKVSKKIKDKKSMIDRLIKDYGDVKHEDRFINTGSSYE